MTDRGTNGGVNIREAVHSRVFGDYGNASDGPLLAVVGALHGNETSGLTAAKRVFDRLKERQIELRGRFVALVGNLAALHRGTRYVNLDLNRLWSADRVRALLDARPGTLTVPEEIELNHLAITLEELRASTPGKVALLDLHTSSAASPPFVAVGDDPLAGRVLARTGIIEVKGTSRYLKGMLVEHASRSGWSAMAFEAGRHEDEASVACHEAMIWQMMVTLEMVDETHVPETLTHCKAMRPTNGDVGRIVEIVYRHAVNPSDEFRMRPGFSNFQAIREGDVLGEDRRGPVRAPFNGRVFLPLYQEQGDEGFFIVRDIGRAHLPTASW